MVLPVGEPARKRLPCAFRSEAFPKRSSSIRRNTLPNEGQECVLPAKAAVQSYSHVSGKPSMGGGSFWIPACAAVTPLARVRSPPAPPVGGEAGCFNRLKCYHSPNLTGAPRPGPYHLEGQKSAPTTLRICRNRPLPVIGAKNWVEHHRLWRLWALDPVDTGNL